MNTQLRVETGAPALLRRVGLRVQVELFSKRRHDPRFLLATTRLPLGDGCRQMAVEPATVAAVRIGIGGRLFPTYNPTFVVLPERSADESELFVTVQPRTWFFPDLAHLTITAEWR